MFPATLPTLRAGGQQLDLSPKRFGELRDSNDILGHDEALQARMLEDGYLLIRDFFNRAEVNAIRLEILERLAKEGCLDPNEPMEMGIAKPGLDMTFRPDISNASLALQALIYSDETMGFFSRLLGGPARHYDFTWMRVVAPGKGTYPHCDIVYMGRGTHNLYTAWVPFGDVPLEVGGLIILENSHRVRELDAYHQSDVDTKCRNSDMNEVAALGFKESGAIDNDFLALQSRYGGRWLTTEYHMGDLLVFSMHTVHGSLDNGSNRIRISSDSRYQLASEPADERWIGKNPPGHGPDASKDRIC